MSRFISLKDKGRNYLDTLTGETVSRRQRDKALRSVFSEKPISNEASAKFNLQTNPELALARPARGRKSVLKASQTEREMIVAARIEDKERKAELAKKEQQERALQRALFRSANKSVKVKHVTKRSLKPGSKGARFSFNTYNEYLRLKQEAQSIGVVLSYSLGMVGYHSETNQAHGVTVFTMESIKNKPIPEERFYERFDEERKARTYFVFQHYFMHVAYKKEFYEQVFADYKKKMAMGKVKRKAPKKRKVKRK